MDLTDDADDDVPLMQRLKRRRVVDDDDDDDDDDIVECLSEFKSTKAKKQKTTQAKAKVTKKTAAKKKTTKKKIIVSSDDDEDESYAGSEPDESEEEWDDSRGNKKKPGSGGGSSSSSSSSTSKNWGKLKTKVHCTSVFSIVTWLKQPGSNSDQSFGNAFAGSWAGRHGVSLRPPRGKECAVSEKHSYDMVESLDFTKVWWDTGPDIWREPGKAARKLRQGVLRSYTQSRGGRALAALVSRPKDPMVFISQGNHPGCSLVSFTHLCFLQGFAIVPKSTKLTAGDGFKKVWTKGWEKFWSGGLKRGTGDSHGMDSVSETLDELQGTFSAKGYVMAATTGGGSIRTSPVDLHAVMRYTAFKSKGSAQCKVWEQVVNHAQVYPAPYILHHTSCTIHPAPYILYTPCILHYTPYTIHYASCPPLTTAPPIPVLYSSPSSALRLLWPAVPAAVGGLIRSATRHRLSWPHPQVQRGY
jgi:hypothetical protein